MQSQKCIVVKYSPILGMHHTLVPLKPMVNLGIFQPKQFIGKPYKHNTYYHRRMMNGRN